MFSSGLYFYILDLTGTLAFALSGNLLASRKRIDLTGGIVLGMLVAVGGGVTRDVILNIRPAAFTSPTYLLIPIGAGVVVYLIGHWLTRVEEFIEFFDAIGLGVFVVIGTTKALDYGMPYISAVLLGLMTGVFGGMLRDVFANRVPIVFQSSNLYVIPGFIGALLIAVIYRADMVAWWSETLVVVLVTSFRMLALWRGWSAPESVRRWSWLRDADDEGSTKQA